MRFKISAVGKNLQEELMIRDTGFFLPVQIPGCSAVKLQRNQKDSDNFKV